MPGEQATKGMWVVGREASRRSLVRGPDDVRPTHPVLSWPLPFKVLVAAQSANDKVRVRIEPEKTFIANVNYFEI
jgi:hypothetical protein